MKKTLLWLLIVMLSVSMIATFSLAGCEKAVEAVEEEAVVEEEEAPVAAEEEEEEVVALPYEGVTLTVMVHGVSISEDWIELLADTIEDKLGIRSLIELTPGGAEGETIMKSRIASGDMPDITTYNVGALLQALNPEENFVDISNEPFTADIDEGFKMAASVNDKLYGIPLAPALVGGWIYNKDIYKELGLEIPTTWDQLMDNCQKAKDAGYTAILGTYGDSWTAQLAVLADYYNVNTLVPDFAEKYTANEAHFADTPEALRGFEKLAENKDFLNEDYATVTFDEGLMLLSEGNVAHYPMLTFAFPTISATYPEAVDSLGVFPQPSDSADINGFTTWEPDAWFITNSCEELDAAKAWMSFMVSQEGIDAYSTVNQISGPLLIKGLTLPSNTSPIVAEIQSYFDAGKSGPALEFISPIKGPNLPQICVEVGSGMKTALQGAQDYDKDVVKQAQQLGIEGW